MARTITAPPTDRSMWRKLLARVHPDHGGTEDLFIWSRALYEHVAGDSPEDARSVPERSQPPPHRTAGERLDFTAAYDFEGFGHLTDHVLRVAVEVGGTCGDVLGMVADLYPAQDGRLFVQQHQGATYRTLAAIGHLVGMSKEERVEFYRICEAIPLSQRHASHLLGKLKQAA